MKLYTEAEADHWIIFSIFNVGHRFVEYQEQELDSLVKAIKRIKAKFPSRPKWYHQRAHEKTIQTTINKALNERVFFKHGQKLTLTKEQIMAQTKLATEDTQEEKRYTQAELDALIEEAINRELSRQAALKELIFDGQEELLKELISDRTPLHEARTRIIQDQKSIKAEKSLFSHL